EIETHLPRRIACLRKRLHLDDTADPQIQALELCIAGKGCVWGVGHGGITVFGLSSPGSSRRSRSLRHCLPDRRHGSSPVTTTMDVRPRWRVKIVFTLCNEKHLSCTRRLSVYTRRKLTYISPVPSHERGVRGVTNAGRNAVDA